MARWHSCNVLQLGGDAHFLWQFDAHSFSLHREQKAPLSAPLPENLVGKSWSSLWQPRLNVAWLPPENVFIRIAQFPACPPDELRSMVELQLEKLSPIPVTQAVWTVHTLSHPAGTATAAAAAPGEAAAMQTVAVTIAARSAVEEFLGQLETRGFMADRLEVPALDQLQAMVPSGDGAWIFPAPEGGAIALVAWWYGGLLRNLALLTLGVGTDSAAGIKDQLMQMAWGGELEGWLTSPPVWHLVADGTAAKSWEPVLRTALEQPIEILAPLAPGALAAMTARRAAQAPPDTSLLPPEFAARYRQKFVDRLWLRGLLVTFGLYMAGLVVYFIAVAFLNYQCSGAEEQVAGLNHSYTNALQIKARYAVLKERQELKYAALDCWEKTAELMPEGLTLDSMNFSDGKKLTLSGSAPAQQVNSVIDFSAKLRKATKDGQSLFNFAGGDALQTRVNPGNATIYWSFGLELNRGEEP